MVNAMQEREDNDWCWVCNESLWCRCGTTLAIFVQHQILLVFIFGDSFLTLKHFLLAVGCYYFEILDQSWNSVTVNWELFFCKFINRNWPSWFALVLKSSSLLNLFFKHLFLLKLFCTLCQLQYCQYGTRIYFEIWSILIVVSLDDDCTDSHQRLDHMAQMPEEIQHLRQRACRSASLDGEMPYSWQRCPGRKQLGSNPRQSIPCFSDHTVQYIINCNRSAHSAVDTSTDVINNSPPVKQPRLDVVDFLVIIFFF